MAAKTAPFKGLVGNNTGRAKMPNNLTSKPPKGKAVYNYGTPLRSRR